MDRRNAACSRGITAAKCQRVYENHNRLPERVIRKAGTRQRLGAEDFTIAGRGTGTFQGMKEKTGKKEIDETLGEFQTEHGYVVSIVLVTDIIDQRTYLFAAGAPDLLEKLGYTEQPVLLEGVMSRKLDFFPSFARKFEQVVQG